MLGDTDSLGSALPATTTWRYYLVPHCLVVSLVTFTDTKILSCFMQFLRIQLYPSYCGLAKYSSWPGLLVLAVMLRILVANITGSRCGGRGRE